jgi:hypothetical protein
VDGTIYYSLERDTQLRKAVAVERNRIIKKMIGEKKAGLPVQAPMASYQVMQTCEEHYHDHGLLIIDGSEVTN